MGEMDIVDIDISASLMADIDELALRHYGIVDDTSRLRVTEVALELYFLWLDLVKAGEGEIGEPVINWAFTDAPSGKQLSADIRGWLFRRR